MALSTRSLPQEKFARESYHKSIIEQACSVKMAVYWFMDRNLVTIRKHAKNELEQYPTILTSRSVNMPCTYRYHFELILHLHVIVLLRNTLKSSKTTRRFGKKTLFEIDYVISITRNSIRTK